MTIEQFRRYQEQSFDAFCKMVIRNEAINEHKRIAARIQREIPLSTVSHAELSLLRYEDTYHPYKRHIMCRVGLSMCSIRLWVKCCSIYLLNVGM